MLALPFVLLFVSWKTTSGTERKFLSQQMKQMRNWAYFKYSCYCFSRRNEKAAVGGKMEPKLNCAISVLDWNCCQQPIKQHRRTRIMQIQHSKLYNYLIFNNNMYLFLSTFFSVTRRPGKRYLPLVISFPFGSMFFVQTKMPFNSCGCRCKFT